MFSVEIVETEFAHWFLLLGQRLYSHAHKNKYAKGLLATLRSRVSFSRSRVQCEAWTSCRCVRVTMSTGRFSPSRGVSRRTLTLSRRSGGGWARHASLSQQFLVRGRRCSLSSCFKCCGIGRGLYLLAIFLV